MSSIQYVNQEVFSSVGESFADFFNQNTSEENGISHAFDLSWILYLTKQDIRMLQIYIFLPMNEQRSV